MRDLTRLRNFGIIAHIDAGKTTVSERMLYVSGATHTVGDTHDGTTVLDHLPQERDRGITIGVAATTLHWDDCQLNLVDTPGHVDFTVEVERSLRVLDGAVAVFDAVAGVEPQSETVWNQAERHGVPRLVFVNKMDRDGADLDATIDSIVERLGATCAVVHLPIGSGSDFVGVIDLIDENAVVWESTDPGSLRYGAIPAELSDTAAEARRQLIETLAERDETLLALWSDAQWNADAVTAESLHQALRRLTIAGQVVPVLCGAALAGIGTQPLLDAVIAWLPSPLDRPAITGIEPDELTQVTRDADPAAPLSALAFKVKHGIGGKVVWTRIYSGTLAKGTQIRNVATGRTERVSRILQLNAGRTADVDEVQAGDIAALIGTKHTTTGDSLCDPNHPVRFESMEFPDPVMSIVVEPARSVDQDKLSMALSRLADEDPTFAMNTDPETGETLMAGMGELHLQVLVENLKTDHGVDVHTGEPKVAHRETIVTPVMGWPYRLSKQTGGPGMFAEVVVNVEPCASTEVGVLEFQDMTRGGSVPSAFVSAFESGAADALTSGPLEGHPVVGVKVTLVDGATHPNDSSEQAFRLAAAHVMRDVLPQASPIVLEPIMVVNITTPDDYVGAVMGLVGAKRGRANDLVERSGSIDITAHIPLAELFGFVGDLRSVSKGRAAAVMQPHAYEARPN